MGAVDNLLTGAVDLHCHSGPSPMPRRITHAEAAGALISTGHLGPEPAKALVEAAAAAGHDRIVLSHPNFVVAMERPQAIELAGLGATIEHELGMYHRERRFPFAELLEWINLIGSERTSLASDLGLAGNALPIETYRQVVGDLPDSGVAERDIRLMIRDNPARLIGLD
jgi:hypothetical protein